MLSLQSAQTEARAALAMLPIGWLANVAAGVRKLIWRKCHGRVTRRRHVSHTCLEVV